MDRRFAWGVWLIVVSLVLGVAFKFYVLGKLVGTTEFDWLYLRAYFSDPVLAWATVIYIVSWPMLFFGIFLAGEQGWQYAKRFTKYITYRYYHRQAKKHVPRLARRGVRQTQRIVKRTQQMVDQGGRRAGRLVEQGTKRTRHILKEHIFRRPPKKGDTEKSI